MYTGKPPGAKQQTNVVKRLVHRYYNSGRTVVGDTFFTTLPLCKDLMSHSLAYVGTLRKNKTYVPEAFGANRCREIHSSLFGFHNDDSNDTCTSMFSVLLLSTVHYNMDTSGTQKKPEVINFYNKYKSGVDSMDQMLGTYTCKRRTRRWPYAFFFNILDIAALATHII